MAQNVSVSVSANSSGFAAGLAAAQNSVTSFKNNVSGQFSEIGKSMIGAFAVGGLIEGIKGLFDEFGKFQDLSDKFGVTAESLQRIDAVAKGAGGSVEATMGALQKGTKNAVEAANGNEELALAFQSIGVSAEEYIKLKPEEQMIKLSAGFEKSGRSAEYLSSVTKALGKSAGDTFAMLQMGPDDLADAFASVSVASNDTVAKLDEIGDRAQLAFGSLKAWGADAIGWIIKQIDDMSVEAAAFIAYLTNLPSGLQAAKEAYAAVFAGDRDTKAQAEIDAQNKAAAAKAKPDVTDDREQKKTAKKAEEDLAKIKEENAKKEDEAHLRTLTLLQKQAELQERLNQLKATQFSTTDELSQEKNKGAQLDLEKELEGVGKDIAKDAEKSQDEANKAAKAKMLDGVKDQLAAKKDALKDAEGTLSDLNHTNSFSVDSLRQIGGGVAGANYSIQANKDELQRQQVTLQQAQVDQLKRVVTALEKNQQVIADYDGSFTDT